MIISKETMLCITVGGLVGFTVTMLNVLLDKTKIHLHLGRNYYGYRYSNVNHNISTIWVDIDSSYNYPNK